MIKAFQSLAILGTLAVCLAPPSFAQSEVLFPAPKTFLDKSVYTHLEPYLFKFSTLERLRRDLRNEVKERASGKFERTCKGTEYFNAAFLSDLLQGAKYDSKIDAQIAKTNAIESALAVVNVTMTEEFSGAQLNRTKAALDTIPKNEISEQMFYRWIGLENAPNNFAFHNYTKEFDLLSQRFLDGLCKK